MAGKSFVLVFVVLGSISALVSGKCPCEDEALCEPIERPQGKEFLMFSTKPNVWRKYDWNKVTTIALFRPWDDELMCEAHKKVNDQRIGYYRFRHFSKSLFYNVNEMYLPSWRVIAAVRVFGLPRLTSFAWNSRETKYCKFHFTSVGKIGLLLFRFPTISKLF